MMISHRSHTTLNNNNNNMKMKKNHKMTPLSSLFSLLLPLLSVTMLLLLLLSSFSSFSFMPSVNAASASPDSDKNFITLYNGYFWNPRTQQYWFPHGFSYQSWVNDLGMTQSREQIEFDLREMKKLGVNSLRVDFVWREIEPDDDQYNWDNYDFLILTAEKYDIKLFPLIGYQWPPDWFEGVPFEEGNNVDPGWHSMHPPSPHPAPPDEIPIKNYTEKWVSDIMSFENPNTRQKFTEFLQAVVARYKDSEAVVAWIIGNEFGYIGLWSYRYDGYDPVSQAAFRQWLKERYLTVSSLNAMWGTSLSSFDSIEMPGRYDLYDPSWADLIQWREDSAADFIALGAKAVKEADPNHLISYSVVGLEWGVEDWRYDAIDAKKIADACRRAGAPLDLWALNTYPRGITGDESRFGEWGIVFAKLKTQLPVLVTETGFTDSETLFNLNQNQGELLRGALWEEVFSGVIGFHIFHWSDRVWISARERGFGVVTANRIPKLGVQYTQAIFNLLDQHNFVERWLVGSSMQSHDIAFYQTSATDQLYNRYLVNMYHIWGPLLRLGFFPTIINDTELYNGDFHRFKAIVLPRNQRAFDGDMTFIRDEVIPAGVHVFSDADLPGTEDYHTRTLSDFGATLDQIFGVSPVDERPAFQDNVRDYKYGTDRAVIKWTTLAEMDPIRSGTSEVLFVWKWNRVNPTSVSATLASMTVGQVIPATPPKPPSYLTDSSSVTMRVQSDDGSSWDDYPTYPALFVKDHGTAKAVLSATSLGSILPSSTGSVPDIIPWKQHHDIFKSIFMSNVGFGLSPEGFGYLRLVGSSPYVLPLFRETRTGETLIYLSNWSHQTVETVKFQLSSAMKGRVVRDLTSQAVISVDQNTGTFEVQLELNDMRILIVEQDNIPAPAVYIAAFPAEIVPTNDTVDIQVNFFTGDVEALVLVRLRETTAPYRVLSSVRTLDTVWGADSVTLQLQALDFSVTRRLKDDDVLPLLSSEEGAQYSLEAFLIDPDDIEPSDNQTIVKPIARTKVDVTLSWGLMPRAPLVEDMFAGEHDTVTIQWDNLRALERLTTFRAFVAIYNSSKTSAVNAGHDAQVQFFKSWLDRLGYADMGIYGSMQPWFERLRLGHIGAYFVLPDTYIDPHDLKNYSNLDTRFLANVFNTLILPDVTVLNSLEISNINKFLDRRNDSVVIATQINDLQQIFGVSASSASSSTPKQSDLKIVNTSHPITRIFNAKAATINVTDPGEKFSTQFKAMSAGITQKAVSTGIALGQLDDVPTFIVNKFAHGRTLLFNFDVSASEMSDSLLQSLGRSIFLEFADSGPALAKLQWMIKCGTSRDYITLEHEQVWITNSSGLVTLDLMPRTGCSSKKKVWMEGYIHRWDNESDIYAWYTSANDVGYNLTVGGEGIFVDDDSGSDRGFGNPTILISFIFALLISVLALHL